MKFATQSGAEIDVTKRVRRRAIWRTNGEKLALRDLAMKVLRDRHGFMVHDLADAFQLSTKQVRRSLSSIDEAMQRVAG